MHISDNIKHIKENISRAAFKVNRDPSEIILVAVTKNASCNKITQALDAGISHLGENRVQELLDKHPNIDKNVNWHLIGSLQTNKVKYIIDKVELIHSLDRISLAKEIEKRAGKINKQVSALVQVNVSRESTKSGIYEEQLKSFLESMVGYSHVRIKGLMTIAPYTQDLEVIRTCFRRLRNNFEELKGKNWPNVSMDYLSMGMSHDYEIAIEEGANMVRIGRSIFN